KRLAKELEIVRKGEPLLYFNLHSIAGKLRFLFGSIEGPPGSPYHGGIFHLLIIVSEGYPFKPPSFRFLTRVYHPNINASGEICVDVLANAWGPHSHLQAVLISLTSLLVDPGLEDPLVPEIAEQYIRNRALYEECARKYTQQFARD
ncbi:UBC-like protein, partial [Lindgomyces ingoldianus]